MLAYVFATVILLGGGDPAETPPSRYYQGCQTRAGGHATIIVPHNPAISLTDGRLEPGDEIAAITPTGECAGTATWTGEGTAITLWEDDPFTPLLDGFRPGDPLAFEVYDASEGTVRTTAAVTIEAAYGAEEAYEPHALFVVARQAATSNEEPADAALALGENYPNPFRDSTTLPVTLVAPAHLAIEVFDALGRSVARPVDQTFGAGTHDVRLDLDHLAPGLYVFRGTVDETVVQRSFTVAR